MKGVAKTIPLSRSKKWCVPGGEHKNHANWESGFHLCERRSKKGGGEGVGLILSTGGQDLSFGDDEAKTTCGARERKS